MLEGSFIPDLFTETLRQYYRHRQWLVESATAYINKMQKALRLINIRLDSVLRDVMGRTGKDIIEAILKGERNAAVLASLAQPTVKTPKAEIEAALSGNWREEYIFELRHCCELYCHYLEKIDECDGEIERLLNAEIKRNQDEENLAKEQEIKIEKKKARKNEPRIGRQHLAAELSGGLDISLIEGVGLGFILCIVCEVGLDLKAFPTAKQFASWLRLTPDVKKTSGKVISSHSPKGKSRLAHALMHSATAIGNMKEGGYLVQFFKRIERKKGRSVAIVATARKLAVISWNMLVKKQSYSPVPTEYLDKIRQQQVKQIQQLKIHENELIFTAA
jgi:transposase